MKFSSAFPVLRRGCSLVFLKLPMEIVYALIAHLFGDLIDLQGMIVQKLFRLGDAYLVQVGVEIYVQFPGKQPSKIRAVVAKEGSDGLQFQIIAVIVLDIVKDLVQHIFPGGKAHRMHPHLKLFREKSDNLVEVILFSTRTMTDALAGKGRFVWGKACMIRCLTIIYRSIRKCLISMISAAHPVK